MTRVWEASIAHVLACEGGIANDPLDRGGLTKYGISQRAYPNRDIETLTEAEAVEIYRRDYWMRIRADELPPQAAVPTFDAAVNQGQGQATRMLQRALGLTEDGIIGPATIAACTLASSDEGAWQWLLAIRCERYGTTYGFRRWGRGWCMRAIQAYELGRMLAG